MKTPAKINLTITAADIEKAKENKNQINYDGLRQCVVATAAARRFGAENVICCLMETIMINGRKYKGGHKMWGFVLKFLNGENLKPTRLILTKN